VSRGVEPPPPLLPHVDLHPITKRRSPSRPMALIYLPPLPHVVYRQTDISRGEGEVGGRGTPVVTQKCVRSSRVARSRQGSVNSINSINWNRLAHVAHEINIFHSHISAFFSLSRPFCGQSRLQIFHGHPRFKTATFLESGRDHGHLASLCSRQKIREWGGKGALLHATLAVHH